MYYYNGRIQFPIKLFDFDTISETESYFLNELQNQDELTKEMNLYSQIDFDPSILIANGNDSKTEGNTKILNKKIKKQFKANFSFKIKSKEKTKKKSKIKFKVTFPIKINYEENINNIFQRMNLKDEEKKGILLDENQSNKEIEIIWAELLNEKKILRNKDKEKINII